MSQRGNHLRKEVAGELERLGIAAEFGLTNGNHQYVAFFINGRRRRYYFPLTPSKTFARQVAISGIKRLVREARV
jgi:hypothetical protein